MDYKKKYKEALEELKQCDRYDIEPAKTILKIFPELEESDYVIKQRLIHLLGYFRSRGIDHDLCDRILNWLEKQGEQKTTDKVEPKFKVGDWIVRNYQNSGAVIYRVIGIRQMDDETYGYDLDDYTYFSGSFEREYHLWTIQDAKDGDVLANKYGAIFINAGSSNGRVTLDCYCYLSVQNEFCVEEHKAGSWIYKDDIKPATKEQRELLFTKMKEAGYEWDADKKVLVMVGIDNNNEDEQYEELMGDDETDLSIEPINEYNTHEPTLEEAKEWNEAYEKGYSLGYENGKNERNPAWSEEDGTVLNNLIDALANDRIGNNRDEYVDWLKSLKNRVQPQWKPTKEQMEALNVVCNCYYTVHILSNNDYEKINSLYDELKKL